MIKYLLAKTNTQDFYNRHTDSYSPDTTKCSIYLSVESALMNQKKSKEDVVIYECFRIHNGDLIAGRLFSN